MTKPTATEYIGAIHSAVDEWKSVNSPEAISQEITEHLSKAKKQVMLQLLGFDKDSSGRSQYKVDHCNGRSGNSIIGDYITKNVQRALEGFVSKFPLELTEKQEEQLSNQIQKDFSRTVACQFKSTMWPLFQKRFKEIEANYLEAVLVEYGIDDSSDPITAYNNMLKLIGADSNGT